MYQALHMLVEGVRTPLLRSNFNRTQDHHSEPKSRRTHKEIAGNQDNLGSTLSNIFSFDRFRRSRTNTVQSDMTEEEKVQSSNDANKSTPHDKLTVSTMLPSLAAQESLDSLFEGKVISPGIGRKMQKRNRKSEGRRRPSIIGLEEDGQITALKTELDIASKPDEELDYNHWFPDLNVVQQLQVYKWPTDSLTAKQHKSRKNISSSSSPKKTIVKIDTHPASRDASLSLAFEATDSELSEAIDTSSESENERDFILDDTALQSSDSNSKYKTAAKSQIFKDPLLSLFDDDPPIMEGVQIPMQIPPLQYTSSKPIPKPSYRPVEDIDYPQPAPPPSSTSASVGQFRSGGYVRHIEPTEDELNERIEYDMDEQDKTWLEWLNEKRKKEGDKEIPDLLFELVMDRLEKEWFELKKELAKVEVDERDAPEDVCAICDDGECENSNAIVFCDGCNLAVHQDCYGVPFIPEGQWLCRKCMVSPANPVRCVFCPYEKGAFKQTVTNHWAHSLCALWIPEVGVANPVYMEPIDSLEKVPKSRWNLRCYICKLKMGACIQCDNKACFTPFHPTCARRAKLFMKMRVDGQDEVLMKAFCDRHSPDYAAKMGIEKRVYDLQQEYQNMPQKKRRELLSKRFRYGGDEDDMLLFDVEEPASVKKGKKGPSKLTSIQHVVPHYIYQRVMEGIKDHHHRLGKKVVVQVCKYWSLKREAGRGAPLLKRLHLEPWTASATATKEDEELRQKKLQALLYLRNDLERVRLQADNIRKREKKKLKGYSLIGRYIETLLHPLNVIARTILEEMREQDKEAFFHQPVPLDLAPDYLLIIKEPMDFSTIGNKIDTYQYDTWDEFEHDMNLVFDNCMLYNDSKTVYWKAASKLKKQAEGVLAEGRQDVRVKCMDKNGHYLPFKLHSPMFSPYVTEADELLLVDIPSGWSRSLESGATSVMDEPLGVLSPRSLRMKPSLSTVPETSQPPNTFIDKSPRKQKTSADDESSPQKASNSKTEPQAVGDNTNRLRMSSRKSDRVAEAQLENLSERERRIFKRKHIVDDDEMLLLGIEQSLLDAKRQKTESQDEEMKSSDIQVMEEAVAISPDDTNLIPSPRKTFEPSPRRQSNRIQKQHLNKESRISDQVREFFEQTSSAVRTADFDEDSDLMELLDDLSSPSDGGNFFD